MSDYTDAINAINEKIQYHSGEVKKYKAEVEHLTTRIGQASDVLAIQQSTVDSLTKARKILVDAETASKNDNPTGTQDEYPFIL